MPMMPGRAEGAMAVAGDDGRAAVSSMPQKGPPAVGPNRCSRCRDTSPDRSGWPAATPVPSTATVTTGSLGGLPGPRHLQAGQPPFLGLDARARDAVIRGGQRRNRPEDPESGTAIAVVSPVAIGTKVLRSDRCDTWSDISSEAGRTACGSDVPIRPM